MTIQQHHATVAARIRSMGAVDIFTGLLHYWDLDDDGTWSDDPGTWNQTESGTVTIASSGGPNSQDVAAFDATGDYLDRTDVAFNQSAYSVSAWAYFTSITGNGGWIISHRGGLAADSMYQIWGANETPDKLKAKVFDSAGSSVELTGSSIFDSVWYHLVLTADHTADDYNFYINNGTPINDTSTLTTPETGSQPFAIGTLSNNKGNSTMQMKGRLGMIGIWSKVLNSAEVAYLYNSGNGRKYADL